MVIGFGSVREAYLIASGKTLEPLGINKKDEMKYIPYFFHFYSLILFLHFKFLLYNDFNGFCFPILAFNVHFFLI